MRTYTYFIKLFISVALMIIISVCIISSILNHEIMLNTQNAIGKSCVDNLNTAGKGIQQLKDTLYKDCVNLSLNSYVKKIDSFNENSDDLRDEKVTDVLQVLDVITKMAQTDEKYYSVYIYLENFRYIFTSDKSVVAKSDFTDSEWLKNYYDYKDKKVPISFINTRLLDDNVNGYNENKVYVTTYIYPLTGYTTSLEGAIVVNVKEASISRMINSNTNRNDGTVLVINGNGEIVCDIDNAMLCDDISNKEYIATVLNSKNASGYFFSTIGGIQYLISYSKSGFNDWIYVGVDPLNTLMKGQSSIKRSIVLLSAVVIIFGVLVAFIVSKKLYKPLNTMVKTIKLKDMASLKENDDEMSIIYKAINTPNIGSRRSVQENCILKLLGDDPPDEENKRVLSEIFCYEYFICIVISIDQYNANSERFEEKQWIYLKALILEISEKLFSRGFKCLGCTAKKGEAAIFCNIERSYFDEYIEGLKMCSIDIQRELAKILSNPITIGISGIHSDMTGIQKSYKEAQIATKQKLKTGLGNIIVWDKEFANSAYYYPVELEEQIRNYLDCNKNDKLIDRIDFLIDNLKNRKKLTCDNIIQIITQLAGNTIIKYMIEHHISIEDVYGLDFNIYSEIAQKETLDELRGFLEEKYTLLLNYLMITKDGKKTTDRIFEYITNNYKSDIGINDISEYVGLSYSHVRKVFKSEIGTNIVDYINFMRIRDAKNMLLNKDLCVKNIAVSLGYNNEQSFERYFKKFVGITPGEFRTRQLAELKKVVLQESN